MRKKIKIIFNLFLFMLIFNACSSIQNFSFYEFFVNPNASELIIDYEENAERPDLESVPEKVEISE
tara:strand:+ start:2120 stop:2317 length:198 start_codon:yes stop_codon:yes gene_type:complete